MNSEKLQAQKNYSPIEKANTRSLCSAQHEWESWPWAVCPRSILASYNFLHNCLNVLILIPVSLPKLCYFLKEAPKPHGCLSRELHRLHARQHHAPWVTMVPQQACCWASTMEALQTVLAWVPFPLCQPPGGQACGNSLCVDDIRFPNIT